MEFIKMKSKMIIFLILLFAFFGSARIPLAATIQAASCSQADVQAAINAASGGDMVSIPAGNCTWTSGVTITKGLTVQGASEASTIISSSGTLPFTIDLSSGFARISQMTLIGNAPWGYIQVDGSNASFRLDHLTFNDIPGERGIKIGGRSMNGYGQPPGSSPLKGLLDHITLTDDSSKIFIALYGYSSSWNLPDDYGSDNAIYIEDSNFTRTGGAVGDILDGECGARFVIRNNRITNGIIAYHDTGSTQECRSTRKVEIYNNEFNCTKPDCGWGAISFRGGTGIYFNNTIPIYPNGYGNGAVPEIFRVAYDMGIPGVPWSGKCDNVPEKVCSNFLTYCSVSHQVCGYSYGNPNGDCAAGTGPCVGACSQDSDCPSGTTCVQLDGQLDSSGWPCRDQTGRGQDDPVTHLQASSPAYWWNNLNPDKRCGDAFSRYCAGGSHPMCWSDDNDCNKYIPGDICPNTCSSNSDCPSGLTCGNYPTNVLVGSYTDYLKPNRDYYSDAEWRSDGSAGIGQGNLLARPATCTVGVAYWATDQNKLYKCTAANTWNLFYIPYTYPHRLQEGADTVPPAAPTGLRVQ